MSMFIEKPRPSNPISSLRALQSPARRLGCGRVADTGIWNRAHEHLLAIMNQVSLDGLTLAPFLPLITTPFRVRGGDSAAVELQLTRATPPRHAPADAGD